MNRLKCVALAISVLLLVQCSSNEERFSSLLKEMEGLTSQEKTQRLKQFTQQNNFPFIEDSTVYFLFEDSSRQAVYLAGDMSAWRPDSIPLINIEQTNFWYAALRFPRRARLEYKFVCGGNWFLDPLNPLKDSGVMGENSVLAMPAYEFPQEVLFKREFRKSDLDTVVFKSRLLKNRRRIYFYKHQKAGDNSPLILFNDGGDYLTFGKARIILDNLIGSGQLKPLLAIFIEPRNRKREYRFNDAYLKMVFQELLPFIQKRYGLKNNRLAMGGVSLGGLISLYALKNYSRNLDFVFSQSGALWLDDERILKELTDLSQPKTFLFLSYGLFENMEASHKHLKKVIEQKQINFEIKTYYEGHNWGNWRAHLKDALLPFAGGKAK
ncbi:alpha/beta hydrolase-fold protein [Calditrichota bacterium LG25]